MKSIIQKFGIVVVFLLTFLQSAAYDFKVNGVYYDKLSNNTVEVTYGSYTNNSVYYAGDIVIPNYITVNNTSYTVVGISMNAFNDCENITSVKIGSAVTYIGPFAFTRCSNIKTIEIPKAVKSISEYAFGWCDGLESITVDSENTTYDSRDNCNAIIETKSNTLIRGCKNSFIPSTVINIGTHAFYATQSLKAIEIPTNVTTIGESAFDHCTGLTSIKIHSAITTIEEEAFANCSGLESITVDEGNTVYDSRENCNAIVETVHNRIIAACKNTIIPNTIKAIGSYAFSNVTSKNIDIPNSVTTIGNYAFAYSDITNLTIPKSVSSLGKNAFHYTYHLQNLKILTKLIQNYDGRFDGMSSGTKIYAYQSEISKIKKYTTNFVYALEHLPVTISNLELGCFTCRFNLKLADGYEYNSITTGSKDCNVNHEGNTITISGFAPESNVSITICYTNLSDNEELKYTVDLGSTKSVNSILSLYGNSVRTTQTSLRFKVTLQPTIDEISEYGLEFSYKNYVPCDQDGYVLLKDIYYWTDAGTRREQSYFPYLKYGDRYYNGESRRVATDGLNPYIKFQDNNAITFEAKFGYDNGDAEITNQYLTLDDEPWVEVSENNMTFSNLEPGSRHTIKYQIKAYGSYYTVSKTWQLPSLEWSDGESIALSTTSARLKYGVNLPDDAVGTGFEWRRIDAPDLVASSTVGCICVDGYLVGTLNSLNPDVYYKFRPFYKSPATGTTYYGDWVGIFTGDATVFFEPEIITSLPQVKETSATLHGYAIQGTETIKAQGFEYRAVGSTTSSAVQSQWIQIPSTDANMVVELSDLKPGYTYEYRGYATTATQTYYSPVQQFTTIEQSGVSDVASDEFSVDVRSSGDEVFVKAQNAPSNVRCIIYNINGSIMADTRIECSDDWTSIANLRRGIYILQAVSGDAVQTKRFIVR